MKAQRQKIFNPHTVELIMMSNLAAMQANKQIIPLSFTEKLPRFGAGVGVGYMEDVGTTVCADDGVIVML